VPKWLTTYLDDQRLRALLLGDLGATSLYLFLVGRRSLAAQAGVSVSVNGLRRMLGDFTGRKPSWNQTDRALRDLRNTGLVVATEGDSQTVRYRLAAPADPPKARQRRRPEPKDDGSPVSQNHGSPVSQNHGSPVSRNRSPDPRIPGSPAPFPETGEPNHLTQRDKRERGPKPLSLSQWTSQAAEDERAAASGGGAGAPPAPPLRQVRQGEDKLPGDASRVRALATDRGRAAMERLRGLPPGPEDAEAVERRIAVLRAQVVALAEGGGGDE